MADRRSLSGGRYTGFQGNPQGWAFANQSYELRNSYGPWDWTGMSSSDIYGPSFSMFGASVSYGGGSYSEMKADAEAVQAGRMNISDYAAKYGAAISVNQLRAIVDFANAGGQFSGGSNSMEMMLVHHGALVLTNSYGEPMQSGEVIAGATYWYYDKIELSQLKGLVGNKISRSSYGTGGGTSRFDSNWQNGLTAAVTVFGLGIEIGTHPSQKPRYWSVSDFNKAAKVGKSFASKISILGAGYSAYELYNNPSGGNGVDLFFGVVGLIPGPGTVIGGIYFGADLLTMGITGKGIGEHIDSYIWSVGPNGVPFPVVKIPGK